MQYTISLDTRSTEELVLSYQIMMFIIQLMERSVLVLFFVVFSIPRFLFVYLKNRGNSLTTILEDEIGSRCENFSSDIERYRRQYDLVCQLAEGLIDLFGLSIFLFICVIGYEYGESFIALNDYRIFVEYIITVMNLKHTLFNDAQKLNDPSCAINLATELIGKADAEISNQSFSIATNTMILAPRVVYSLFLFLFVLLQCNRVRTEVVAQSFV